MNPTARFSNRVRDYLKYRPSYPAQIVAHLRATGILADRSVIADIGSGTGLLTELFLRAGNEVYGVEPNAEMRAAGEKYLKGFATFRSVNGTAESTTLPRESVDLITAGQAFHWFNRDQTRQEFHRILRPGGHVALIWNERQVTASPFLQAYEALLHQYSPDYQTIDHRHITDAIIQDFFRPNAVEIRVFPNEQVFDYESLKGRLLSSSYAPAAGHPRHEPMLAELQRIFDSHQQDGKVRFLYETKIYTGKFRGQSIA